MISDSELLRTVPKVGTDLFFWRDDNDNIKVNVLTELDIKKKLTQVHFSLLTDGHGDMRDMTVNKGAAGYCLVKSTTSIVKMFNSDALDLDGCKVKELEAQWGWKVNPEMTYSFHMYTDDDWVADQLKYLIRRKFGVVCANAPYSSEVVLAEHKEKIYDHLRQFLPRLPQIREDYFNNPPPPPPDKLENARPAPPLQEKLKCNLCGAVICLTFAEHMNVSHYSGPNALDCDLCPCTFETVTSMKNHRSRNHVGAEPQQRSKFGIRDMSAEVKRKCDAQLERIPLGEGTTKTKYGCIWVRENGQKCGQVCVGSTNSREHVCTHLRLKPYTCPLTGCSYASASFKGVVRHYQHEGEEEDDEKSEDHEEEKSEDPPKKQRKC
ncbi:uncharacterized protein LOC110841767 [Folsomia candida]|uniref:Zinc finger protein 90 n=1 Tax=Folsomia candida TaxID=158441 RepID=A0A226F1V2_FOLCA|nr:uncharacterized protein LOC110841767 [Folsomia candida]OXA63181.1 Zinc finger protein 90 [Folsomia candida]